MHLWISGKVQGVFFRANTLQKANILGLKGWVRNLDDGRVELVVEGPKDKVEKLVEWCQHGPEGAEVENVKQKEEPYIGEFREFIRLN